MVEVTITGKTKLLGVIGHPIEHSLSPVMHNAAIAKLGLNYVYLPFPIHPDDLQVALAGFAAIAIVGFNVTIPHKQAIIPLLSEVSPIARAVGAVNTVWRTENGWSGTNTDVSGFLAPLLNLTPRPPLLLERGSNKRDWNEKIAVILGYGGAARSVVAGLAELGVQQIYVVGRHPQKLTDFIDSWKNTEISVHLCGVNWVDLPDLISTADILVNTTPIGMYPQIDDTPVSAEVMAKLKSGAIAYDLIYTPNPTVFLRLAKERGAIAIDGLEMLVQQGAAALEIWLKQPVPVDVMRQSLRQHLGIQDEQA